MYVPGWGFQLPPPPPPPQPPLSTTGSEKEEEEASRSRHFLSDPRRVFNTLDGGSNVPGVTSGLGLDRHVGAEDDQEEGVEKVERPRKAVSEDLEGRSSISFNKRYQAAGRDVVVVNSRVWATVVVWVITVLLIASGISLLALLFHFYCTTNGFNFHSCFRFYDMTCSSFSFAGSRDHESHYHGEFTKSIFLPYYAPFSSNSTPMITATLPGGRQHGIAIDTGSTGLLLGAPLLPDIDPSAGTPAHSYLSSSRILYTGRLVEIPIKFHGRAGATAVARVPVLVVDESVVCPWYDPERHTFACPYNPNEPRPVPRDLSKIAYMGVGFGRNGPKEGKPIALPSLNPFINVVEVNGENVAGVVRQGYTMSTEGVQLGLTAENTRGFVWKDLEPGFTHDKDRRDWAMVGMCFSLDDRGRHCGPALIDTGVAQMYLRTGGGPDGDIPTVTIPNPNPNGYAEFVQRVKPGTKITVEFPREDQGGDDEELEPVEEYSFRVGEGATLMEPAYVVPAKRMSPAFVNTGRNFLYGCSVAFDAEGGRFGFRRVTTSSSSL